MAKLVIPIDWSVTIADKHLSLDQHNQIKLGIFNSSSLKNSKDKEAGVRTLASPGKGAVTLKANYKDAGIWQGETDASSFASVYDAHLSHRQQPYEEFLVDEIYTSGDIVAHAWFNASDGIHLKRSGNAVAGLGKRAYANMAWKLRYLNSIERRGQKGFELYAIGTGQTLSALSGKVVPKDTGG